MLARSLRRGVGLVGGLAVVVTGISGCAPDPIRSTLSRPIDPVVLTGSQVTRLAGAPVDRVVALRASSAGWAPIPVQVDERRATTMAAVYNLPANQFPGTSTNIPVTVYADPNTFVGA